MHLLENIIVIYTVDDQQTMLIDHNLNNFITSVSMEDLLNVYCKKYGLDFDTTILNSRKMMKIRKNPPLILDFQRKHAYFRVFSGPHRQQIWIKYSPDIKCKKDKDGKFYLIFRNNFLINVDFDQRYLKRQHKRMDVYFNSDKQCVILDKLSAIMSSSL
jgi:competence transcription factor ComK